MRDRRFDRLYELQKQPVKRYILERFAEELARELEGWPPPVAEWVSEDLRARWAAGLAERPREQVIRLALALAKLDLARDLEGSDRLAREEGPRAWQGAAEEAAGHLLLRFVTEKALALKEWAEGARIARSELVEMIETVERRLFRVTER